MNKHKSKVLLLCIALAVSSMTSACQMKATKQEPPTTTAPVTTLELAEPPATESESESRTEPVEEISAPSMKVEEYPKVDGSTATLPLSQALYQLVTGASALEAETAVIHTKTTNAYEGLIHGYGADLVLAYEPAPSVYEEMKSAGVNLTIKPIGKDALVFMTNEGNPVRSLTGQQIRDIYSGRIHNWSEVGGAGRQIQAFQRPVGSGSQTLMDKLVMQGTAMDPDAPASMSIGEMGELIEKVASYNNQENAIGYSVYFYARNMYTHGSSSNTSPVGGQRNAKTMKEKTGLRFMAVDGVMPENSTIKDGSYPYVNEFYAAIREDEPKDSPAYILFDWMTTDDGQALVESLGYVGLGSDRGDSNPDRNLAFNMENPQEAGGTRITFTDQERFLINADYVYGTEGVLVMDENMEVLETLPDVRLISNMEMADLTRPVILEEAKNGGSGLYDLKNHTWILEPQYRSLYYREDEGCYYGFLPAEDREQLMKICFSGSQAITEKVPDYIIGSRIWNINEKDQTAVITDQSGREIKTVNFKDYLNYQYAHTVDDFFMVTGENEEFELFNADGESLLNEASIEQGRPYTFLTLSLDGTWMEGSFKDTGDRFIYDLIQKKVVTRPDDSISVYVTDKDSNYIIENQEGIMVYESGHKPVLSEDSHPYEFVLGGGYFAYQEDDGLIVESRNPKTRYRLPVKNLDYGYQLSGKMFHYIADEERGSGSGIYLGDTFLMNGINLAWWETDKYLILGNEESRYLVVGRDDGRMLHELNDGRRILKVFEEFMVVERGNYLCVMDYQGRYAFKQLLGHMNSD